MNKLRTFRIRTFDYLCYRESILVDMVKVKAICQKKTTAGFKFIMRLRVVNQFCCYKFSFVCGLAMPTDGVYTTLKAATKTPQTQFNVISIPNMMQTKRAAYGVLINSKKKNYHQTSNISRTLVGNYIVDHSDVVGAAPAGDAPTTSEWSTMASINCAKTSARRDENHLSFVIWCVLYWRFYGMHRCPRHALAGRPGMWQGCCLSHVCVPQGRIPSPGRHSPCHWHQLWGIAGSISSLLIDDLTLVIYNRTPTISPE